MTKQIIRTGVINVNELSSQGEQEIWDMTGDAINLSWENFKDSLKEQGLSEEEQEKELEMYEEQDDTFLIGFKEVMKGKNKNTFMMDRKQEFSAVLHRGTLQILRSKFKSRGRFCSPCYPDQIDLASEGVYRAYTLPPFFFED